MSTQPAVATTSAITLPKMTMRQRLLVQGVAEGKSVTDAGKGLYCDRQASREAFASTVERLAETMDAVGLSEWEILARVRELTDADKVTVVSRPEGIARVDIPDNQTRIKAVEIAANMRGLLKRDTGVSIGTVNILWAGGQPAWAKPSTEALVDASVNANANDSVSILNSNDADSTPAISTIEGTGRDRPGPPHTHSQTLANRMVSRPSKTVKKRGPRLPVYRGPK